MFSLHPFLSILQCVMCISTLLSYPASTPEPEDLSYVMPKTDILIDVGHGGIDGGTSYGSILEKDINLQIATKLYAHLHAKHYNVAINRTSDYALSDDNRLKTLRSRHQRDLSQRKEIANRLHPEIMVSLHVNWSKRESASGAIVMHQKSEESKQLATAIQHSLNAYYQREHAPYLGKKYFLLNHSLCPTVIVEMGYISNEADRHKLTDFQEQMNIVHAIADGIEAFLEKSVPER